MPTIKCPNTYCDRYEEEEIIESFGMCAFCDHVYGEWIDEQGDC